MKKLTERALLAKFQEWNDIYSELKKSDMKDFDTWAAARVHCKAKIAEITEMLSLMFAYPDRDFPNFKI